MRGSEVGGGIVLFLVEAGSFGTVVIPLKSVLIQVADLFLFFLLLV